MTSASFYTDTVVILGTEVQLYKATYTETDLTECKKIAISGVLVSRFFNAEIVGEFTKYNRLSQHQCHLETMSYWTSKSVWCQYNIVT